MIEEHGSLQECFRSHLDPSADSVFEALCGFVDELTRAEPELGNFLLPSPGRGSACKRLNLFLRWMVRNDEVDPGGWEAVPARILLVPLDTHMFRICSALEMTCRSQADMKSALEVTGAFREYAPDDPVRYDFAITRLGMGGEESADRLFRLIDKSQC